MKILILLIWNFLVFLSIVSIGAVIQNIFFKPTLHSKLDAHLRIILGFVVFSFMSSVQQITGVETRYTKIFFVILGVFSAVNLLFFKTINLPRFNYVTAFFAIILSFFSVINLLGRNFNFCDDNPAYIFFLQKLEMLGNIKSEYSLRRLVISGLTPSLQSLSIPFQNPYFINSFDDLLTVLLLLYLASCYLDRKDIFILQSSVLLLVLGRNSLGLANSSPILGLIFFTWMALSFISLGQKELKRQHFFLIFGLFFGFVLNYRSFLGFFLILFYIIHHIILRLDKPTKYDLARFFFGLVLSSTPWFFIQFRDTRSIFFPISSGGISDNFKFDANKDLVSFQQFIHNVFTGLNETGFIFFFLLIFLIVLLSFVLSFYKRKVEFDLPRHLVIIFASTICYFILFAYNARREGPPSINQRYWVPILLGAILFTVEIILRHRSEIGSFLRAYLCMFFMFLLYLVSPSINAINFHYINGAYANLNNLEDFGSYTLSKDLNNLIKDKRILAASDDPSFLLNTSYVDILDLPGMVVPDADFPFDSSYRDKIRWIKQQPFDFIFFTRTNYSKCLYSEDAWKKNLGQNNSVEDWTPFMLEWFRFTEYLASKNPQAIFTNRNEVLISINSINEG